MSNQKMTPSKPALLCVAPPYSTLSPPAGIGYLLAYAKRHDCDDFSFLDLRLGVSDTYAPTYTHTGIFGESFVMDVPDLPLVLSLVRAVDSGAEPASGFASVLEPYCRERGIPASYLTDYLGCLDRYFSFVAAGLSGVKLVGCSVWTSNFLTTLLFAAHLKQLDKPPIVVGGGPQLTESRASAAIALRSRLLDYVVTGEGEVSLLDLYSRLNTNDAAAPGAIPGTLRLGERDEVEAGPTRPLLANDQIPVPVFDQMPLLSYRRATGVRLVPYHLSRGCTDKCTFCSEWVFWQRFRPGDANQTVSGVQELTAKYGAQHILFTDSLLNGHRGKLQAFAEGMLEHCPGVMWHAFMRAEMDAETAALLKRSGCASAFIGIESMSDETLALMNKRRTESHNIKALRAFLQAGIHVIAGVIPGFPGDSREAFIHTVEQLRAVQQDFRGQLRINVEPFIVSPAQPLFSRLADVGLRGMSWDEETLNIAPRYADITAGMFCTVEGANQGLERMGRLRLSNAIQSERPVKLDSFDYRGIESLERSRFNFEFLTGGWFLSRVKGPSAWTYALIVNDSERSKLESKDYRDEVLDVMGEQSLKSLLKQIESTHIIQPRRIPVLIEGGYSRFGEQEILYQLSPYVVSRQGDWHVKNRLFVVDFVTANWRLLPSWQGQVLKALQDEAQTASGLQKQFATTGVNRPVSYWIRLLEQFADAGFVLIKPPKYLPPQTR
jgi:radical SAM superfamily enzyme YgiQ (UPF0313 family)